MATHLLTFDPRSVVLNRFSSSSQPCKHTSCLQCGDMMLDHASEVLKILGGVGLFFSFTEVSRPPPTGGALGPAGSTLCV